MADAALSVALFLVAGVLEVAGGWLVWGALREGRPRWWLPLGAALLVAYGVVPTWQPEAVAGTEHFSRIYAIYGGYFIIVALLWGWVADGKRPDVGDCVGTVVVIAGVAVMTAWPRSKG